MMPVRRDVTARAAAINRRPVPFRRVAAITLLVVAALALTTAGVSAADPTAAPGGDVRTSPGAPGLVGDPLFALAGVIVVGLVSVAVTLVAIRLADRR